MKTEFVKSWQTAFDFHNLCVDIGKTANSKLLLLT